MQLTLSFAMLPTMSKAVIFKMELNFPFPNFWRRQTTRTLVKRKVSARHCKFFWVRLDGTPAQLLIRAGGKED
jgi:hypothetical protein